MKKNSSIDDFGFTRVSFFDFSEQNYLFSEKHSWVQTICKNVASGDLSSTCAIKLQFRKEQASFNEIIVTGTFEIEALFSRECVVSLEHFLEPFLLTTHFIVVKNSDEVTLDYNGEREVYLFEENDKIDFYSMILEQVQVHLNPYPKIHHGN